MLLTVQQVAERLQVSTTVIYRLVECRRLGHVRIGRAIRFKPEDVDAYIAAHYRPSKDCDLPPAKPTRELNPDGFKHLRSGGYVPKGLTDGFKHLERFGYVPDLRGVE